MIKKQQGTIDTVQERTDSLISNIFEQQQTYIQLFQNQQIVQQQQQYTSHEQQHYKEQETKQQQILNEKEHQLREKENKLIEQQQIIHQQEQKYQEYIKQQQMHQKQWEQQQQQRVQQQMHQQQIQQANQFMQQEKHPEQQHAQLQSPPAQQQSMQPAQPVRPHPPQPHVQPRAQPQNAEPAKQQPARVQPPPGQPQVAQQQPVQIQPAQPQPAQPQPAQPQPAQPQLVKQPSRQNDLYSKKTAATSSIPPPNQTLRRQAQQHLHASSNRKLKTNILSDSTCRLLNYRELSKVTDTFEEEIELTKYAGATTDKLHHMAKFYMENNMPDNLIIVAGLNDVLKQKRETKKVNCEEVTTNIINIGITARENGVGRVCISEIIKPKFWDCHDYINKINQLLRQQCEFKGFQIISQSNIGQGDLGDNLHVSRESGHDKLKHNILSHCYTYDNSY